MGADDMPPTLGRTSDDWSEPHGPQKMLHHLGTFLRKDFGIEDVLHRVQDDFAPMVQAGCAEHATERAADHACRTS